MVEGLRLVKAHNKRRAVSVGFGLSVFWVLSAHAEIIRYVDAQGRLNFYYRPDAEPKPRSGGDSRNSVEREQTLVPLIEKISYEHDMDPALIRAVMRVESNFQVGAVSPKGATGLMQLMPATAKSYGVEDIADMEQNIRGGVRFLRHLKNRYGEDLKTLLAAYNAGETAVARAGGIPPYSETQQYVVDVIHQYERRGGVTANGEDSEDDEDVVLAAPAKSAAKPVAKPKPKVRPREEEKPARPIRVRVDRSGRVVISNVP